MIGVVKGAEEHERQSFDGPWRGRARSIWLRGRFEMTARLDADEIDACSRPRSGACERSSLGFRERALSGARQVQSRRVQRRPSMGFHPTRGKGFRAFDAGAKILEVDIDVCLQATGKASPSSSPYKWLIV
jgi:hypothetical protein